MGNMETDSGTGRNSSLPSILTLPYVDLTHLPDETTPCASTEPLEAAQMDTTAEQIRRGLHQTVLSAGHHNFGD